MSEWLDIETAPKNGREIIILLGLHAVSARWLDNERGYSGAGWVTLESREGFYEQSVPRGWMPLPSPPVGA